MANDQTPLPAKSGRTLLIVAGSPRLAVDAIRFMQVAVTGRTGAYLAEAVQAHGVAVRALVSEDAAEGLRAVLPSAAVATWVTRDDLERLLQETLRELPDATVLLTAAINDYDVDSLSWVDEHGETQRTPAGLAAGKVPSGATEVQIHLRPARKLIADLPAWGHRGRLIACKYSPAESVVSQAEALQRKHDADLVLANALDGSVQALVAADDTKYFTERSDVLAALTAAIVSYSV